MVGAGALLSGAFREVDAQLTASSQGTGTIPPHRALQLPGLHAYAERSIAAGETIHFRTSSTEPYRLSICRLAGEVDDQSGDVVLHTREETQPKQQPINPGSYVHVEKGLSAEQIKERIDARALKEPTGQHVIACWPLTEEKRDSVADISPQQCQGRIINHATWMIGGPSFNSDKSICPSMSSSHNPKRQSL